MKRALFPGSFDPFTIGHYDIVKRGLTLFDEVIIGIGHNADKHSYLPIDERMERVKRIFADEKKVRVVAYDGLTVDCAKKEQAQFILRGVRSVQDYEYERSMADANLQMSGIETVLLYSKSEYAYISSSLVRDLMRYNKDISHLVPTV